MKKYHIGWIALIVLCLHYQNSEAQYIGLHYRGDTVGIDSAVVIDINTYRSVRNYNATSSELIDSKISLINTLENQLSFCDSIMNTQRMQILFLDGVIYRKDTVIESLSRSFDVLEKNTIKTIDMLDRREPFFSDARVWIGIGVGFVSGVLLLK